MKLTKQIKLYILSLMFLFLLVAVLSIDTLSCDKITTCSEKSVVDYLIANWLSGFMLCMVIYCEVIRREFEYDLSGGCSDTLRVLSCKNHDYENLTFLATYIIPFVGLNFDSIPKLLAYIMLITLIGAMLIKTGKYYANPTLALFGYQLFITDLSDSQNHYCSIVVITKSNLKKDVNVSYKFLSTNVCFVKEVKSENGPG
ncbi:anti-phage protein KwaA [Enterovibrio norvegicus]|uniref:anti-phage protein KwaA n=1 Tax=Enterovibrio norvegicus TaxID=188144 RepID=UPI000C82A33E|nr:anti-phage protein KwaA [Enterovibrio norvegicus]PMN65655.1 hypothetical protein BCT27_09590 [Enterovibrio norvegicus]